MKRPSSSRPPRGEGRGPRRDGGARAKRGGDAARAPAARADARSRAGGAKRTAARPADPAAVLARQPWVSLRPLVPGGESEVEQRLEALRDFARLLLEWNRGVSNLVSRHDEPRLVERHLRESLVPAREIAATGCERFVDFGSGAGLPAVPLGVCGIGRTWTLVESRRNKTLFLRKIKQELGLEQFEVLTGRLEILVDEPAAGLACDGFTSRATAAVGPTLELAQRLVTPGGFAFLWKGSSYEGEMEDARDVWSAAWGFERAIPIPNGPNVVAVFKKKTTSS